MARLTVYKTPGWGPPEEHSIPPGLLVESLDRLYPDGFSPASPLYYYTPEDGPTRKLSNDELCEFALCGGDTVHCLCMPKGPLTPGAAVALVIGSLIASLLVFSFIKPARRHDSDDAEDQSDRVLDLKRQNGLVQINTRIPSAYGNPKIYPSLATEGYVRHNGQTQELTELFLLAEGKYGTRNIRLGDSPLSELFGVSASVYGPNQRLPSDLRIIRRNKNVDKLLLRAPDEVVKGSDVSFIAAGDRIELTVDIADSLADARAFRVSGSSNNDGVYTGNASGGSGPYWVDVDQNLTDETSTGVFFELPTLDGQTNAIGAADDKNLTITDDTLEGFFDWQTIVESGGGGVKPRSGLVESGKRYMVDINNNQGIKGIVKCIAANYRIEEVGGVNTTSQVEVAELRFEKIGGGSPGWASSTITEVDNNPFIRIRAVVFDQEITGTDIATEPNWTPYYTVGTTAALVKELWFTYGFPGGLWEQKAGKKRGESRVRIDIQYQRIDNGTPVGTLYTDRIETEENSRDTLRYTQVYKLDTEGVWRIRWRRLENERLDTENEYFQDETRVFELAGAVKVPRREFAGVTTLVLRQNSSDSLAALSDRRLNLEVQRKLQRLQPDGSLGSDVESTSRMIDALIDTAINDGDYSTANIDMAGFAAIQNSLDLKDGGDQGKFSHVFTKTLSVDDQLQTIADSCRCILYRIGQKLYLARDEGQAEPGAALFTRRNMLWESYSRQFTYRIEGEPDGVALKWVDPSNNFVEREYTHPSGAKRPKRVNVAGIANWAQAYRRAIFEYNSLVYAVDSLTITATEEAQMLVPFDMVRVEDVMIHRFRCGEIMEYDNQTKVLTLDRDVTFEDPSLVYTVVIRNPEGFGAEEIACTPGNDARQVVLAESTTMEILDGSRQLRTLFAFGAQDGHMAERWTVNSAKVLKNKVRLTMTNYDVRRFAGDVVALPPTPTI